MKKSSTKTGNTADIKAMFIVGKIAKKAVGHLWSTAFESMECYLL